MATKREIQILNCIAALNRAHFSGETIAVKNRREAAMLASVGRGNTVLGDCRKNSLRQLDDSEWYKAVNKG